MRKILSTAAAISILASNSFAPVAMALEANALPVFDSTHTGNANVEVTTPSDVLMNIKVTGGQQNTVGTAYWNSFNIGKDSTVNVEFTNSYQTSLNYVKSTGGESQIYGRFTDSLCSGASCGFVPTSKVILINPNGIAFGGTANVNMNSFAASTLNGTYNEVGTGKDATRTLSFTKLASDPNDSTIKILDGAKVYGDKSVVLVGNNISAYRGSQIATNVGTSNDSLGNTAYGKVKLITADGVNFTYAANQTIEGISDVKSTDTDVMTIYIDGEINAGHIDIRNASKKLGTLDDGTETGGISMNGATLKATKAKTITLEEVEAGRATTAVQGSDGNIWLTSESKIVINAYDLDDIENTNTQLETAEAAGLERADGSGGNIRLVAKSDLSLANSLLEANDKITLQSNEKNVKVGDSYIVAKNKDIEVKAEKGTASIQTAPQLQLGTELAAEKGNINITAGKAQTIQSTLVANGNININSTEDSAYANSSLLTAGSNINITSDKNLVKTKDSTLKTLNGDITLKSYGAIGIDNIQDAVLISAKNITLESTADSINLDSLSKVIDLGEGNSSPQFVHTNGNLTLKAAKDVEIKNNANLTVSNVILDAKQNVVLESTSGTLTLGDKLAFTDNTTNQIQLKAGNDVKTVSGVTVDLNSVKTNIEAGNDINVTVKNADNPDKGMVATSGRNMTINAKNADGTAKGVLSVSSLISGKDMTLNTSTVIKGNELLTSGNSQITTSSDPDRRAYIEANGKFNSFDDSGDENFVVTASDRKTDDGRYNQRHHIQYGDEKILLINNREIKNPSGGESIGNPDFAEDFDILNPDDEINKKPVPSRGSKRPISTPPQKQYGEGSTPEDLTQCPADRGTVDVLEDEEEPSFV